MRIVIIALVMCLFISWESWSALRTNYFKVIPGARTFITQGVFVGGKTEKPTSLINFKLMKSKKKKRERMVLNLGDLEGRPGRVRANYYQVHVKENPPRLIIDLSEVHKTGVGPEELRRKVKKSKWVIDADITMDPVDHSTSLVFKLIHPLRIAVSSPAEALNNIYIDMGEKL